MGLGVTRRKAALWQTHVDRHLAAFKAIHGNAGTSLLAFDTATSRLALARADAAANAQAVLC